MELALCERCGRHVKAHESECPFCQTDRRSLAKRAGIAATFAFGVGVSLAGCDNAAPAYGPPPPTDSGGQDSGALLDAGPAVADAGQDAMVSPAYGPAMFDAGQDAMSAAAYGPAPFDAGPGTP